MTLPAILNADHFEVALVHSNSGIAGKSRQMVDLNGSYNTKTYDMKGMGGKSQINDLGLMTVIANTQSLVLSGDAIESEDLVDNTLEQHQLGIELLRAFGVEVAQMGAFIQEVMAGLAEGSPLSVEQKVQLKELVSEIITLKKLTSLGALPNGAERLNQLIAQTADKIADLLKDGLDTKTFSKAIAEFTHSMLKVTAAKYNLPALSEKLIAIEGRMNPQNYLKNAVAELVVQLTEMLKQDDISEDAKAEIEKILEELADHPEGKPLSRDIIKQLDALGETLPERHATKLEASVSRVKDANIVLKAAISGLSVAEVKQVEKLIANLEDIKNELVNNTETLTAEQEILVDQLSKTIEALDANPADINALKEIKQLESKLPALEMSVAVPAALANIIGSVIETIGLAQDRPIQQSTVPQGHHIELKDITIAEPIVAPILTPARSDVLGADDVTLQQTVTESTAQEPRLTEQGHDNTSYQPPAENNGITETADKAPDGADTKITQEPTPDTDQHKLDTVENVDHTDTENKRESENEGNEPEVDKPSDDAQKADPTNNDPETHPQTDDNKNETEVDKEESEPKPEGKDPSCGETICLCDKFNLVSEGELTPETINEINKQLEERYGDQYKINDDGTVTALDENGKVETITYDEMTKRIERDVVVENIGQKNFDKLVDKTGGLEEALKRYKEITKLENEMAMAADKDKSVTFKGDDKKLDDNIRAALEARKAQQGQEPPDNGGRKTIIEEFTKRGCPVHGEGCSGHEDKKVKKRGASQTVEPKPRERKSSFKGRSKTRNPS